jgi:predicted transposase/invertase (TIGR01784 family)
LQLSDSERAAYESHAEELHYQASMFESTYVSGKLDGIKQEKQALARLMKQNGEPLEKIAQYTQLPVDDITAL